MNTALKITVMTNIARLTFADISAAGWPQVHSFVKVVLGYIRTGEKELFVESIPEYFWDIASMIYEAKTESETVALDRVMVNCINIFKEEGNNE